MVNQGLRPAALVWAWTQIHAVNWHPLTTLAHMTMCEFFGLDPRAHHALNIAIHAANAALCFLAFRQLTGQRWLSAFVAAVFALHPLRVESVAWVSELKDLLSGFFWFLALLAYARYARQRTRGRYVMVAAATVGALLCKPMAVTLPATLLLLDFWPLRRWPGERWQALVLEKAWLFLLAAAHSVVTILVQFGEGAGDLTARVPLSGRIGNAVVSYLHYLEKIFWPANLAALYPHPLWWPWREVLVATGVVIAISLLAWRYARRMPWGLMGWLWFLGTLVPAIGLIQVGIQAMADRYTYIPALGVTVAVAWTTAAALHRAPGGRWIAVGAAAAVLVALGIASRAALVPWKSSVALFEHALRNAEHPTIVRYWLGVALTGAGRRDEAIPQFKALLREDPTFINTYPQLSTLLKQANRPDEAIAVLRLAVTRMPDSPYAWNNLATALLDAGKPAEAGEALATARRLNPDNPVVHGNLGLYHAQAGRNADAIVHFREAVRLNPWWPGYYNDLAVILFGQGEVAEARALLEKAMWINPHHQSLAANYAAVLEKLGDTARAAKFRAADEREKSRSR